MDISLCVSKGFVKEMLDESANLRDEIVGFALLFGWRLKFKASRLML